MKLTECPFCKTKTSLVKNDVGGYSCMWCYIWWNCEAEELFVERVKPPRKSLWYKIKKTLLSFTK